MALQMAFIYKHGQYEEYKRKQKENRKKALTFHKKSKNIKHLNFSLIEDPLYIMNTLLSQYLATIC